MSGGTTASVALRARRKAAGLSQEQLAERAHCSVRTIRTLESGTARRPHRDTLRAVADALHLDRAESDDFVASWRAVPIDRFLDERAREEAFTQTLMDLRRGLRDIAVHHTLFVDSYGEQSHTLTRRTFEATTPGIDRFAWLAGRDGDAGDPGLITTSDCVNMRFESKTLLPTTGAVAFVAHLGAELQVGEVRSVGYRHDLNPVHGRGHLDREGYFAAGVNLELLEIEIRFDAALLPTRVFTVRRSTVHDASGAVETEVPLSPFHSVVYIVRPAAGNVYGLRWEWPGDAV